MTPTPPRPPRSLAKVCWLPCNRPSVTSNPIDSSGGHIATQDEATLSLCVRIEVRYQTPQSLSVGICVSAVPLWPLLQALEVGVYNHIPGDGREFVCLDPSGVKIRAEDGRRVSNVDISAFINHLPGGKSVASFTTEDASGSTSQAANILEALEAGARALLMDEDTCATNFMIR